MKVKTDDVGSCRYLTAGKEYELRDSKELHGELSGFIVDDEGDTIFICSKGSEHIDGNDWKVVDQ